VHGSIAPRAPDGDRCSPKKPILVKVLAGDNRRLCGVGGCVKLVVHDYSGHAFPVQLTRTLARRGHQARHVYSAGFQTPKGPLKPRPDDPATLAITPLSLDEPFRKEAFFKRRAQEIAFGRMVAEAVRRDRPDAVISGNAPLDVQRLVQAAAREVGARYVYWLQDLYGEAIYRFMGRRFPGPGHAAGLYYQRMERGLLRDADAVVAITDDFRSILMRRGVPGDRVAVIENWAILDELPALPRDNGWAEARMPTGRGRVVYSGTLGYKHDPEALLTVAAGVDADLYVFSEGRFADWVAAEGARRGLTNLHVRPWAPFEDLAKMFAGADVLLAMIEEDAGVYSVPSKILSYMCAGRPIVASIPPENLAARLIARERAGLVNAPARRDEMVANVRSLLADPARRAAMGANARAYAERAFDIEAIADRFERVLAVSR
jgi:colanic acid biosynthesis glycosyl transferase WcaI